jgi:hypothetical protein
MCCCYYPHYGDDFHPVSACSFVEREERLNLTK